MVADEDDDPDENAAAEPLPGTEGRVHVPVLLQEVLDLLAPQPGMTILDGTVGLGGHALRLAEAVGPSGRIIGLDRDEQALARAKPALAAAACRVDLYHGRFSDMAEVLEDLGVKAVDRILLDIGVSSLQLDDPARGFSFSRNGPLDMRMDPSSGPTAAEWLARAREEELLRIFREYGEERFARRAARRIAEARSDKTINTTERLADLVRGAVPRQGRLDPATRVFQALRIAVNDELGELERGMASAPGHLAEGGRLAVISFHSLEDRRVKEAFRAGARQGRLRLLTKKPVRPGPEECRCNPRARSARLRAAEVRRPTPEENPDAASHLSPVPGAAQPSRPVHRP